MLQSKQHYGHSYIANVAFNATFATKLYNADWMWGLAGCFVALSRCGVANGVGNSLLGLSVQGWPLLKLLGEEQILNGDVEHFCNAFERILGVAFVSLDTSNGRVVQLRDALFGQCAQGQSVLQPQPIDVTAWWCFRVIVFSRHIAIICDERRKPCSYRNDIAKVVCGFRSTE